MNKIIFSNSFKNIINITKSYYLMYRLNPLENHSRPYYIKRKNQIVNVHERYIIVVIKIFLNSAPIISSFRELFFIGENKTNINHITESQFKSFLMKINIDNNINKNQFYWNQTYKIYKQDKYAIRNAIKHWICFYESTKNTK